MPFQTTTQLALAYGGPPLIGAFIGYLTNDIAIRMLFRPLKPWRIFGLRVPLTPGVIPSKRHQLAENIGEMVGGQLLTPQDIGEALSKEQFQEHLRRLVNSQVQEVLNKDVGPLLNVVPQRFRVHARIGLRSLKHRLRQSVLDYLASPALAKAADGFLSAQLRRAGSRRVEELLRAEDREGLHNTLEALSKGLLTGPGVAVRLGDWLERTLIEAAAAGKTAGDFLPAELRELACSLVADHAPQVLDQAAAIMAEPPMRERVAKAVRGGVDHFIDGLGPMAAMAKGFLNMDSLDAVISAWLADREGDLAAWLKQPEIEQRTAEALRGQTETFFAAPLAELLAQVGRERLHQLCQQTAAQLLAALTEGPLQQMVSSLIKTQVDELLKHGQISLSDLADKLLTRVGRRRLRHVVLTELRLLTDSEPARRLIGKLVNALFDQLTAKPAGVLRDLLPAEVRNGISEYLTLTANRLLIREVPGLTESLRIRELVRNKVNSLDLLRLERLLLSIMEEQFKYINLFGALLGFLIGLLNLAALHAF